MLHAFSATTIGIMYTHLAIWVIVWISDVITDSSLIQLRARFTPDALASSSTWHIHNSNMVSAYLYAGNIQLYYENSYNDTTTTIEALAVGQQNIATEMDCEWQTWPWTHTGSHKCANSFASSQVNTMSFKSFQNLKGFEGCLTDLARLYLQSK